MKELVYTSAPAGLRPGTSGFCTVAMSDGLPVAAVEFLERLSNTYRPVYMPYDPRAADNPVAVSLVRGRPGGQAIAILSRNGAAGTDHTGRTNNLAHHLVFDPSGPGDGSNPAATAGQPGVFLTRWDEPPRRLSARKIAGSPGPRGLCRTWEDVTGDAGWAATLAAAWAGRDGRPLYVIYPRGTNALALMAEAMNLLPVERRWDCTFTTYFTGLPAEATCVVRGVLEGTPQEAEARRGDHVDLADLAGPAPDGAMADRARGRVALGDVEPAVVAVPPVPARPAAVNAEPVSLAPVPQTIFDEPPPMRAVRGQSIQETEPGEVVRSGGLRLAWVTVAVFGPLTLLSLACGGVFGKVQIDARHEVEQERDEVRKQKEEAERELADARQKLAEPVKPPPIIPVGPVPAEPNADGDLIKLKAELGRVKHELETQRTRADEAKAQAEQAKLELAQLKKPNTDPRSAADPPDSLVQFLRQIESLPQARRAVAYHHIAAEADAVLNLKRTITDKVMTGKFDVELQSKAVPFDSGEPKKRDVYVLRPTVERGALTGGDKTYSIRGWYVSATKAGDVPNCVPKAGMHVNDISIPLRYFDPPKEGVDKKKEVEEKPFWYIQSGDLPADAIKHEHLILVLVEKGQQPPAYLMWFRVKPSGKPSDAAEKLP